ncbi:MAG: hypothetical protein KAJ55_14100, partial [Anaerolineales bacterium]|nr:hypothetical protein [Anaerolineales bacterium]
GGKMTELISFLRVVHIISAILMAWPFYALVAVNQRVKLGPPLGDRVDIYIENLIKNRTIPCFVFQGTVGISGLALIFLRGQNLGVLVTSPALGLKFILLLMMAVLLSYVNNSLQPRVDALFAEEGNPIAADRASRIGALRTRRKKLASVCMFLAFTSAMLGMQVWVPFPLWLSAILVIAIGLFTWRAYQSEIPYGWV